jgi:hypothetical protein
MFLKFKPLPLLPTQMSGPLFPTGFCPDIGSHKVHPALARCPEPCLFGGRDGGGLWECSDSSCHSLVGSFKIEFFFFFEIQAFTSEGLCKSLARKRPRIELIFKNLCTVVHVIFLVWRRLGSCVECSG